MWKINHLITAFALWATLYSQQPIAHAVAASSDASLSALAVSEGTLTPAFSGATLGYRITVANRSVSVAFEPVSGAGGTFTATGTGGVCTGTGTLVCPLAAGRNVLTVTVTAADTLTTRNYVIAVRRPPVAQIVALAEQSGAKAKGACAVASNFELLCWGGNYFGALGNGEHGNDFANDDIDIENGITEPMTVALATGAVSAMTDYQKTCVTYANGTARCWGLQAGGQLGDGVNADWDRFAVITSTAVMSASGQPMTRIDKVVGGMDWTGCALHSGRVWCWGTDGTFASIGGGASMTPFRLNGIFDAIDVANGDSTTCAVIVDGTVRCLGKSSMLGIGNQFSFGVSTPVSPILSSTGTPISHVVSVDIGVGQACALLDNATAQCWSANGKVVPLVDANGEVISDIADVSMGQNDTASCIVMKSGTINCWGGNSYGTIGDGTTTARTRPAPVLTKAGGAPFGNVVEMKGGSMVTCVRTTLGDVYCWGRNSTGEVGDGELSNRHSPVLVIEGPQNKLAAARFGSSTAAIAGGSEYALTPAFISTTQQYTLVLPYTQTAVSFVGAGESDPATAFVTASLHTTASTEVLLLVGGASRSAAFSVDRGMEAMLYLTSTDAIGGWPRVYRIAIVHGPSDNANLSNLQIYPGVLSPAFLSTTTSYTAVVMGSPFMMAAPDPADPNASAVTATSTYGGACGTFICSLKVPGVTTVTVQVTAEDRTTTKDYSIVVLVPSDDATLSNLDITPGVIGPVFVSSTTNYTAEVPFGTLTATVQATARHPGAVMVYSSTAGICTSAICPLTAGAATTLTVQVMAEDGVSVQGYYIVVTHAAPPTTTPTTPPTTPPTTTPTAPPTATPSPLTTIGLVWPNIGVPEGGMPVSLFGTGFSAATAVRVSNTITNALVAFTATGDARIDFVMPDGEDGTAADIIVLAGSGDTTAAQAFRYVASMPIPFDGDTGVVTAVHGITISVPPQGVSGMFVITLTPVSPADGVPGSVLMHSFRLDALLNWVPLSQLTNPITIALPVDPSIVPSGERPWLYQWVETTDDRRQTTDDGSDRRPSSVVSGQWVLVRSQEYESTTRVVTVALRPMGVYALSTAILRSYWFPVVPVLR
jgi:alpha-tubulin suppressor-like RCC1 family protein